jgi:hypothetical protein
MLPINAINNIHLRKDSNYDPKDDEFSKMKQEKWFTCEEQADFSNQLSLSLPFFSFFGCILTKYLLNFLDFIGIESFLFQKLFFLLWQKSLSIVKVIVGLSRLSLLLLFIFIVIIIIVEKKLFFLKFPLSFLFLIYFDLNRFIVFRLVFIMLGFLTLIHTKPWTIYLILALHWSSFKDYLIWD